MSRVTLVGPEEEENLSLRYLASSLGAAGFAAEILPFNTAPELSGVLDAILSAEEPPAVVGISLAFQWRAKDFLALAVALRDKRYAGHITAGGHFGAFACRELLADFPEIDSICLHEADETIVSLTCAVVSGRPLANIPGLAFRNGRSKVVLTPLDEPPDLASLAWPDRRGEPEECLGHRLAPIVGSRGCYGQCAFCCIAAWHAQTPSGRRFRTRPVADLADEMAWLNRDRDIDIFIFHDDNFFLPGHRRSLARIHALADALEARGVERFATVIKARPTDITREIVRAAQDRLGLIRAYLGIETDSEQGLHTLARGVRRADNWKAMEIAADRGLYVGFNLLIFDPDTQVDGLEDNLAFAEAHAETPINFGRVELYAGTPLLARMQTEARCTGDYLAWDYRLANPEMQHIFKLVTQCFFPRTFAPGALANHLPRTRFQVEVCRHFHPEAFEMAWLADVKELSRQFTVDTVAGFREIIAFVQTASAGDLQEFVRDLCTRLRRKEKEIREAAECLERRMQTAIGACCKPLRLPGITTVSV